MFIREEERKKIVHSVTAVRRHYGIARKKRESDKIKLANRELDTKIYK